MYPLHHSPSSPLPQESDFKVFLFIIIYLEGPMRENVNREILSYAFISQTLKNTGYQAVD
jgi:hypothetical protein